MEGGVIYDTQTYKKILKGKMFPYNLYELQNRITSIRSLKVSQNTEWGGVGQSLFDLIIIHKQITSRCCFVIVPERLGSNNPFSPPTFLKLKIFII